MANVQERKGNFYPVSYSPVLKKNLWGEGYSTLKGAERNLAAWDKKVKGGYVPENIRKKLEAAAAPVNPYQNILFSKVYEDFVDTVLENTYRSKNNRDTLKIMVSGHVLPVIGEYPIKDITFGQIQTMFSKMVCKPGPGSDPEDDHAPDPLSASSKRKIVGYMNKIYEYAIKCKYIESNPCRDIVINAPSVVCDKPVWDPDTLFSFLDWCRRNVNYSYYLAFLLAATTAARRGEYCAVRYGDIKDGCLYKSRGMDRYGDTTEMKNHVSHRGIYLMPVVLEAIEEQRRRQTSIIHLIGNMSGIDGMVKPWDYILTDEWNNPIKPDIITKNFRKAVIRYQEEVDPSIPYISLKGLRDTYASIALASGENVKEVSEQLGHSKPSTTLNRYASLIKAPTQGLNKRMGDRIFGVVDDKDSGKSAQ